LLGVVVGEWLHEQVKANVKKHQRLAKSIFRIGRDIINEALFKWAYGFDNALKLLFPFLAFNQLCASG
jgi:hypothetical protein